MKRRDDFRPGADEWLRGSPLISWRARSATTEAKLNSVPVRQRRVAPTSGTWRRWSTINGRKHWLWRAVDQQGAVLDVLVQTRRDKAAVKRLMRKLLMRHGCPRVIATDKLRSYAAANNELGLNVEHGQHKGLNSREENSHQPTRVREKVLRCVKSARRLQRFTWVHAQVSSLFMHCRYNANAQQKRQARKQAFKSWETGTDNPMLDGLSAQISYPYVKNFRLRALQQVDRSRAARLKTAPGTA